MLDYPNTLHDLFKKTKTQIQPSEFLQVYKVKYSLP